MSESTKPAGNIPQRHYKRSVRNVFVHKPMQKQFTFILVACLMVSMLAIAFIIHTTFQEVYQEGLRFTKISPYEVLSSIKQTLLIRISCVLLVTLVVIGAFGIFFLHRIAGPMYRFRQILLKLNDGHVPANFTLREGDFFQSTATELNRLLTVLQFEKNRRILLREKLDAAIKEHDSQELKQLSDILNQEPESTD